MAARNNSIRTLRDSPYLFDELGGRFHRTAAGVLWRWRTELALTAALAAGTWRLAHMITLTWALAVLGGLALALAVIPHTRRFITRAGLVRAGPAPAAKTVLGSPAAHPHRQAAAHPVDSARPRSANARTCCAGPVSAWKISRPASTRSGPPASPATPGSPATPAGPSWSRSTSSGTTR